MNNLRAHIALICLIMMPAFAQAQQSSVSLTSPMVADVSQQTIEIRSDFNGKQLLIFGARNVPGDLVIAVRGPSVNATLRRKDRIAGMWMHVDQRSYNHLPIFYALASTKPLSRIAPPAILQSLGLGERRIIEASNRTTDDRSDNALGDVMIKKRWWQLPFGKITYFGESLFKARIDLPDTLPSGDYTAEVYLFNRGKLIGFQTIPLKTYKIGFDANVAHMATHQGLIYGLSAILMALFGGWLGHRLFYRH